VGGSRLMSKISIRFYNNHEVRAVWKDDESMWYLAIVDIVAAITESVSPRKYWSVLKTRLKKQGNELATSCSQLKLMASDGKRYHTDCISQSKLTEFVKLLPGKSSMDFLDWFTYSDNTLDGQSRKKAYELFESGILKSLEPGSIKCLQQYMPTSLEVCIRLLVNCAAKTSAKAVSRLQTAGIFQ